MPPLTSQRLREQTTVLLSRRPMFDAKSSVYGFELVMKIRRDGYRVGLHIVNREHSARGDLPNVDFIRVDSDTESADSARSLAEAARRTGALACARQVDSIEQFERVKDHFEVFQGTFYQRRPASDRGVSTGRLATLQLLAECANPDASLEAFEGIIGRDPSLTFRVMQLANSGYASLPRRLNSVREALITVGVTNIRNLAMIASLNRIEDQHPELLSNALVRAKVCELLARRMGLAPSVAFTAGLLSMLDAFLGVSLDEATEKAALNDELRAAIMEHQGPLGSLVRSAIQVERADVAISEDDPVDTGNLADAYATALAWSQEVLTNSGS